MVVDASAIVAILAREPEGSHFRELISLLPPAVMSAGSYLEARIVAEARRGTAGAGDLRLLLASLSVTVLPFDEEQAMIAAEAYARYGRGRHPANLNFGDCFAYALSRTTGEPLLFKGDDFAQTDVVPVTHP